MRQSPQRLGDGVFAVDTLHVPREADASYLIVDGGRAAFVDTGSHRSVPNLLGSLMASLPRARVVVHPRGAPHLTDPARHALLDGDVMLNATGLDVWLRRAA